MLLERIANLRKLIAQPGSGWYGQQLSDTMTEWEVIKWEIALGTYKPPYTPTFRRATGTDGQLTWPLNSDYFATMETAEKMADLYGAPDFFVTQPEGKIVHFIEVPFGGNGGIFSSDANEYHIKLADGRLVNAGLIAGYYIRNPEDSMPGVADKLIRSVLGIA